MTALIEVKPGDEIEVDRARLTQNGVQVRKDGVWIVLLPPAAAEAKAEAEKNAATLGSVIDQMCSANGVFQGDGPSMAYFQTPPDANGAVRRFVYVAFGNDGIKAEGEYMRGLESFADALRNSTVAFETWLQPRRTLVWRERPIVDLGPDGLWRVYWRCVQLDDGARSIAIDWHF